MARTLCVALCSILALAAIALADDMENENQQQTRPLEPTESDLESFRLTSPESDLIIDDGDSAFFRASGVGMFAASAADIATTEWGLSQGLHEANPAASQRGPPPRDPRGGSRGRVLGERSSRAQGKAEARARATDRLDGGL